MDYEILINIKLIILEKKLINVTCNTCNDNENITVLKNYIENENSRKI